MVACWGEGPLGEMTLRDELDRWPTPPQLAMRQRSDQGRDADLDEMVAQGQCLWFSYRRERHGRRSKGPGDGRETRDVQHCAMFVSHSSMTVSCIDCL